MKWLDGIHKKIFIFLLPVLMLLSSGCVRVLHHEPSKAAMEAENFANVAFVQHDSREAYDILADEMKNSCALDEFTSILLKMHPYGYPSKVSAVEYEPIPGQPAINIYLRGQNEKENFYYRLVMVGTGDEGYKVGGLFRGNGPPPESSLRRSLTESSNNSSQ